MEIDPLVAHMVNNDFQVAKEVLLEGKEYVPMLTFVAEKDGAPCLFPTMAPEIFQSKESRRLVGHFVKVMWERIMEQHGWPELKAVLLSSDVYKASLTPEESAKRRQNGKIDISVVPGRIEELVVYVHLPDSIWQYELPYARSEGRIAFAEVPIQTKLPEHAKGSLMNLWPL